MKIGVFFGGKSPEHDVSIITGQLIISTLKKSGHEVVPIYLDKSGAWYIDDALGTLSFFKEVGLSERLFKCNHYSIDLGSSKNKLVFKKIGLFSKSIEIDLAFPAFHGMNGEDGTIQGLFEIFNIPYVGCEVGASAVAMDKILTKQLYQALNILTTKFIYFSEAEWTLNKSELIEQCESLNYPVFVKPPKLGSSIGISKVNNRQELEFSIEVVFNYGERALVEAAVLNLKDLTCAVIGNDNPITSLVQESRFDSDFFNYEEKYLNDGGSQLGNAQKGLIIPADLDTETTTQIQLMAKKIYNEFGCSGIARVDFLYNNKTNELFANEINPLPGTLYHHLWQASGIELPALIEKLIIYAKERHQAKNKYTYGFNSDILKFATSSKLKGGKILPDRNNFANVK
jgi:D-alanine-D-alanine ligase